MNHEEKYQELVPNATAFEKEVMQEMVTHIKKEMIKKIRRLMECDECSGRGERSTPSSYYICSRCEGTGCRIDGCFNDAINDLKGEQI